jgi:hypothetical protein
MLKPSLLWSLAAAAFFAFLGHVSLAHGQTSQPADTCSTHCTDNEAFSSGYSDVRELSQTLAKAYPNSIMQDASSADLETEDLQLEDSSIVFSLRMLDEVGKGVCRSSDPATQTVVERACPLDDELAGLNDLSDTLSYAASRLERISDAASRADLSNPEQSLFAARIRSMEHLYRMVFALSNAYLDSTQRAIYLRAADEQLQLANSSIENERALCSCDPSGLAILVEGLSQLSDRISSLQRASLP